MGQLGRVLGRMHGAHAGFTSLTGVGRHWYDPTVSYAAFDRARGTGGAGFSVTGMRADPPNEEFTRLWVEQPSRMRAEGTERELYWGSGRTSVVDGPAVVELRRPSWSTLRLGRTRGHGTLHGNGIRAAPRPPVRPRQDARVLVER